MIGQWQDGASGCASIRERKGQHGHELRKWYYETDESVAKPIIIGHDRTVGAYVDELSGLTVKLHSDGRLEIVARGNVRARLREGTYLAEEIRFYSKQ